MVCEWKTVNEKNDYRTIIKLGTLAQLVERCSEQAKVSVFDSTRFHKYIYSWKAVSLIEIII